MISAGESSGDTHAAALMAAAWAKGHDWRFHGLGGERMAARGARLLGHINETAVMGLTEVAGALPRLMAIRARLLRSLELDRPDLLALIDFPDFNFGLARRAFDLKIPVVYYICPQVWAWRRGRLKFLAKYAQRRAVLFAFEKKFYEDHGVGADWVGHPILDELPERAPREEMKTRLGFDPRKKLLALMPGSRLRVVERLAPLILEAANLILRPAEDVELVLPRADSVSPEFLERFTAAAPPAVRGRLRVIGGLSREILAAADAAIAASGTSSVEAAILGLPHVVAYRVSPLSWFLGRLLVSVPYASIANLTAGREIVPEFLQGRATAENIAAAARPLLDGGPVRDRLTAELAAVSLQLGQPGASGRVVDIIAEELAAVGRRNAS
jgi:lipid-A-disaccharide synthase